jgi:hypothetical protein
VNEKLTQTNMEKLDAHIAWLRGTREALPHTQAASASQLPSHPADPLKGVEEYMATLDPAIVQIDSSETAYGEPQLCHQPLPASTLNEHYDALVRTIVRRAWERAWTDYRSGKWLRGAPTLGGGGACAEGSKGAENAEGGATGGASRSSFCRGDAQVVGDLHPATAKRPAPAQSYSQRAATMQERERARTAAPRPMPRLPHARPVPRQAWRRDERRE